MNRSRIFIGFAALLAALAAAGCAKQEHKQKAPEKMPDAKTPAKRGSPHAKTPAARPPSNKAPLAHNRERYDHIVENDFRNAARHPLSTFSIDVDTASYTNVRRLLNQNQLPPPGAVRIEEMINYFRYEYPEPEGKHPLAAHVDSSVCPWNPEHRLVRIGLKGKTLYGKQRPRCNLVFLLDVSGSMSSRNKLPLVKSAMRLLLERLYPEDRVAIVVYASQTGILLPSTPAANRDAILNTVNSLHAGGSTNGGSGIQLAYKLARDNFLPEGVNRVILCTDGDFNVGVTSNDELVRLAVKEAKSGVTLSVLGFGGGNLNDSMMNQISNRANGNYAYIDSAQEARKALVQQANGTLVTIAKDVKVQIDFNPAYVQEYRLIGYEDRMLKQDDFRDDGKDAGDMGAGHTVTALYEIVPPGSPSQATNAEPSKYQPAKETAGVKNGEMLTVRLRYKCPKDKASREFRVPLKHGPATPFTQASDDFRFAASVAAFGMLLRNSKYKGTADYASLIETVEISGGKDTHGYRREFQNLVRIARRLTGGKDVAAKSR